MTTSDGQQKSSGTSQVLACVAARLETDDAARSLWLKIGQEMADGGVPSAISYLETRFFGLSERVKTTLGQRGE
jgi:hypothetical protein